MRFLSLSLVTPPVAEPVSLDLAKQHLRVDFDNDDEYIPILITAAREFCEAYMQRKIYNQTWQRTLDYFPIWAGGTTVAPVDKQDWMFFSSFWERVMIQLPGRVQSVTDITYVVPNGGGTQTLDPSDYVFDGTSIPARLVPAQGMTWPVQTLYQSGSVAITYVAGSYERAVSETFAVPSTAPYQYSVNLVSTLIQVLSVVNSGGSTVAFSNEDGQLTFDSSLAGQTLTVKYTVDVCPLAIKQAILLLLTHFYEYRGAVTPLALKEVPMAVKALLNAYTAVTMEIA